jgi:type IV pilus assembly protein PilC
MQTFSYLGIDRWGRNVAGRMLAEDEASLEEKLRANGLWLVEAKPEAATGKVDAQSKRWSLFGGTQRRELINFCTLMGFQLKVGIPMVQALQVASEDCENVRFKLVLQELKRHVEAGQQLCEALEKYPKVFSLQFVSLVRAGEQSSALPETFMELKRYMEWQEQIVADVRQATIYPVIVLIVVCVFVLMLFTFVIPKFVLLLKQANVALPLMTRIVFGASDFAKATWWMWLLGGILIPAITQIARRASEPFAIFYDRVKFRLPIFGDLNHMLAVSRFAHNLAVLYRSGVIITQALKLCEGLVGSTLLGKVCAELSRRVESGDPLSEAMRSYDVFPLLLIRMAVMGEKTGNLDHALENVAEYYNLIIPRRIKKIFSILEPSLIIFLVFIVGAVALAIFTPILSLMGSIR